MVGQVWRIPSRSGHGFAFGWEEVTAGIDLTGKTALVTGANSGLGLETMRVRALRGALVIGTARSMDKAREACATVKGMTVPLALELTDFDSVVACAREVQRLGVTLDLLICNAGVMEIPTLEQVRGIEKHFVVNHLGHFLLTHRLLPQVLAAQQGRVVVLSSGAAIRNAPATGIEFDNLSGERDYEPRKAYGQSKLANVLAPQTDAVVWVARDHRTLTDRTAPSMSRAAYREALRHLWLRGADGMQVYNGLRAGQSAIALAEVQDAATVYDELLKHRDFLDQGQVMNLDVPPPQHDGAIWSGLRLGDHALVRAASLTGGDVLVEIGGWQGFGLPVTATADGVTYVVRLNREAGRMGRFQRPACSAAGASGQGSAPAGRREAGALGTKDLIHRTDRFRAIRQRADSLGAAEQVDFIHLGDRTGSQNDRVHRELSTGKGTVGRGDNNNIPDPCNASGKGAHQNTRRQGSRSTGHV